MINIPDSNTTLSADLQSAPGDSWLDLMTTLLAGGAMYQPWIANDYRLTSRKAIDVQTAAPNASYRQGEGAKIVGSVQNRPEISRLRNRVTVRKVTPGEPIISWTQDVTDAGSRAHPDRLAELMGSTRPIILGEKYDESGLASEEEAKALAISRLSEATSYLDRLVLETYVDRTSIEGHQIIDIDLVDGNDHYSTGNWLQRVSEITVDGPVATCKRELTRTVSWR
jgi:hypothetical protein